MKKIIAIIFLSLCILNMYCSEKSSWGIKAGLNYSGILSWNLAKYKGSGFAGGFYSLKVNKNWYFQPELLFSNIGTNLKDDGYILKEGYVSIYGIETPVNMSYRPSLNNKTKMIFDMGLYSFLGLFGKKEYKYYELPTISESPFDTARRFSMGINLGIGMQYDRYSATISYQRGLTSLFDNEDDAYHQSFRLAVGYSF